MTRAQIDAAAIAFAHRVVQRQPRGDFLFGGSPSQAASNVGGYYSTAANNLVNSTGTGSPAATTFGNEEAAALRPQFQQQDQQLLDQDAAAGITNSGSAKYNSAQLGGNQAATLAGAISPLYQEALSQYGNIEGQGAGAQANAYEAQQAAVNQGFGSLASAVGSAFGAPMSVGTSGPNYSYSPSPYSTYNPYDPYNSDPSTSADPVGGFGGT